MNIYLLLKGNRVILLAYGALKTSSMFNLIQIAQNKDEEKISSFESPITILLSLKKLIAMRKPQVVPVFCLWPHFQFAPFLLVYSGWIQFVPVLIPSHQPLFLICHPLWEIEHARMLVQVTKKSKISVL